MKSKGGVEGLGRSQVLTWMTGRSQRLKSTVSSMEWLASASALVIAFLVLGLAIWDEPLHIDELRQIGYYKRDLWGIVNGASSQTQPPLDYIIGSWVQDLLGSRNLAWRLQGFVFAWGGLFLLSRLLWKTKTPAWVAVALAALTPVFFGYSSYARPYALPFFLMILMLWSIDRWRTSGRVFPYLVVGGIATISLPLSRTTEPPVFLFLTLVALMTMRFLGGKKDGRWTFVPAGLTVVGLAISLVVLPRVQTSEFRTEAGTNELGVILSRLWLDILPVHARYSPLSMFGLLAGFLGIVVAVWLVLRRKRPDLWWVIPMGFTPFAVPIAFAALALPQQSYFDRYAYFATPALAFGIAVLLGQFRAVAWVNRVGVALLFIASIGAVQGLADAVRADYSEAAEVAVGLIDQGDLVLYEQDSSIARYRPGAFPGVPLFARYPRAPISTELISRGDKSVVPGQRPLILVLNLTGEIEGWTKVGVGGRFDVLVPEVNSTSWSPGEQAVALWQACQSLRAETGSYLCVTATRIFLDAGELEAAQAFAELTLDRIEDDVVRERVQGYLEGLSSDLLP